ncbi:MAG: CvpA family protein [Alphaproteobacteria bacterium]|nr:CvpA family protein [Alphaproteobacteria bacterium]
MNPLDIGVIAIVALSAIFAFARGFVREALSILAWVGAAAITLYAFGAVYRMIDPLVANPLLSELIAVGGTFIVSLIVLTILTGFIARSVRSSALSPIDRSLGFIFGLVRGAALVSLAYLLLDVSVQPNDRPVWMREAKSMPFLAQGADMLRNVLPESLKVKSTSAAEDTTRPPDSAREADRAMRALSTPTPSTPAASTPAPSTPAAAPQPAPPVARPQPTAPATAQSYPATDRRNMDRLIGSQR